MTNPVEYTPGALHRAGLDHSLGRNRPENEVVNRQQELEEADRLFSSADELLDISIADGAKSPSEIRNLKVQQGIVARDHARVHAGLGRAAERNRAVTKALGLHGNAMQQAESRNEKLRAEAEMGATHLVAGRICVARYREIKLSTQPPETMSKSAHAERDSAGEHFKTAFYYLPGNRYDTDHEYLKQVVTHGPAAVAVFGPVSYLGLGRELAATGREMAQNGQFDEETEAYRLEAIRRGTQLMRARTLTIVRLGALPLAGPRLEAAVANVIAGPYIVPGASAEYAA